MRVGIICEGTTDYEVLKVVVEATLAPRVPTFTLLQPDVDRLAAPGGGSVGTGWQAVRTFLRTSDVALRIGTFDMVVVHVDADIEASVAGQLLAEPDDEPGGLDALCRLVKGWIGTDVPSHVIIVLPRRSTDAWLVAAHTNLKDVEAILEPAGELAARGMQKARAAYARLAAAALPALLAQRRRVDGLPELGRFVGKVFARQRDVPRAARRG